MYTLNNYTDGEFEHIRSLFGAPGSDVRYHVVQEEIGEGRGTPHLQGYLHFAQTHRRPWIKRLMESDRVHLEPAIQSGDVCSRYCSKDETRVPATATMVYGEMPSQGQRTDLSVIHQLVLSQPPDLMSQLVNDHFSDFIRYHRGIIQASQVVQSLNPRNSKTHVTVCCGPPGTGKTRFAYEQCPGAYVAVPPNGTGSFWLDGYTGQDQVIIDDFYGWIPWSMLLQMLDRYSCRLQTKGGTAAFRPSRIVITSNQRPESWYAPMDSQDPQALSRRIDYIRVYRDDFSVTEFGSWDEPGTVIYGLQYPSYSW